MAGYVVRSAASTGARELARLLEYRKVRELPNGIRAGDRIVCWGEAYRGPGIVLNGAPIRNKYQDALALRAAGVPTIEVAERRPVGRAAVAAIPAQPGVDPALGLFNQALELSEEFVDNQEPNIIRRPPFMAGVVQLIDVFTRLNEAIRRPVPVGRPAVAAVPAQANGEWIGRRNNHVGGRDLLQPPANPDYWAKKEDIVEEFRVHSFQQKSIRAGSKVHRVDFRNPSPWIRSWDGGWRIVYDGVKSKQVHRDLAHQACRALNLDFGAVDIGRLRNGNLIVLEVNRAPGIEGGTVERYATAIKRWERGE